MRDIRVAIAFMTAMFCIAANLPAQQAEEATRKPADAALREKWQKVYREIAESLEMRHRQIRLDLHAVPLLYYSNPVRNNDQHGTMFLWTEEGRPAVLGSVWSAIDRRNAGFRIITHEFHSLADDSEIQSSIGGQLHWASGEPGIAWRTLEEVAAMPAPADTRAARLVQMRALARRFSAKISGEEETELRLMPQPLYRYPENIPGGVDGGLFVYSLATDPELVLLIEQSKDSEGSLWKVAFARFGNLAMEVKDGDRTLWTCERGTVGRSDGKYFLRWRVEQRPADLEAVPAP